MKKHLSDNFLIVQILLILFDFTFLFIYGLGSTLTGETTNLLGILLIVNILLIVFSILIIIRFIQRSNQKKIVIAFHIINLIFSIILLLSNFDFIFISCSTCP